MDKKNKVKKVTSKILLASMLSISSFAYIDNPVYASENEQSSIKPLLKNSSDNYNFSDLPNFPEKFLESKVVESDLKVTNDGFYLIEQDEPTIYLFDIDNLYTDKEKLMVDANYLTTTFKSSESDIYGSTLVNVNNKIKLLVLVNPKNKESLNSLSVSVGNALDIQKTILFYVNTSKETFTDKKDLNLKIGGKPYLLDIMSIFDSELVNTPNFDYEINIVSKLKLNSDYESIYFNDLIDDSLLLNSYDEISTFKGFNIKKFDSENTDFLTIEPLNTGESELEITPIINGVKDLDLTYTIKINAVDSDENIKNADELYRENTPNNLEELDETTNEKVDKELKANSEDNTELKELPKIIDDTDELPKTEAIIDKSEETSEPEKIAEITVPELKEDIQELPKTGYNDTENLAGLGVVLISLMSLGLYANRKNKLN